MDPTVLIVSCQHDVHVDAVTPHLDSLGVTSRRLTPDQLLDTALTLNPSNATGTLHSDGHDVLIDDIGAVWFRKPEPVNVSRFAALLSKDEIDFVQAEAQEVLDGTYALLANRFWLTNPPASRLAARKMLQLSVAHDVGFVVPRSIVTSDFQRAMEFGEAVDWDVAIKSLSWACAMRTDGERVVQYGVYCRRLTKHELKAGLEHVRFAPAMLQEYIPKRCDLRVVAVGRDRLFSVEIDSQQGRFSAEDCRFQIGDLPHRLVEVPGLVPPIRRYMQRMGLHFACFDFAVSRLTGEPVFLEANVNGQWLWLQKKTGAPIAQAVAETLGQHALSHCTGPAAKMACDTANKWVRS